ncbi:MAG: beta-lactamase family protein [Chitinophagaceae bacterium]|nr:beta-lactamase family protein [Chitinophagaceae bacterium]MDP3666349.1 serine hydrolase domain-containing protein [Sediminibacterium sp.]
MLRPKMIALFTFLFIACGSNPFTDKKGPGKMNKPVIFSSISDREKDYYANAIAPLYQSLLLKTGFNGSILLAKNGEIVFEDYHGFINFKTREPITANTPFHIASVSKTMTAAVILKLMEEGKIYLEDGVEKYLPFFPYPNITIKDLLTHRSGLPKYDYFMDGTRTEIIRVKNKRGRIVKKTRLIRLYPTVTGFPGNKELLQYMVANRPPVESFPNRRFNYCNTNYAMLALIIEKVTHMPFPEYMREYVFKPLGMTNTYVFSSEDTANYIPSYNYNNTPFKLEKLDCIYGDKNVYSTVRDLLLWDKALYMGSFISTESLNMAFQPYSNEFRGYKNYGLGWHLLIKPPDPTIVYHNGWWHGNNAVFKRLVADSATVIILGNKFNRNIWSAGKMSSVFTGHADTTLLED